MLKAFNVAEFLLLLVALCGFAPRGTGGFLGELVKNVATNALNTGLQGGLQQIGVPVGQEITPHIPEPVQQTAGNENNPLANSAATKLEAVSKGLKDALESNPFFKLAGLGMEMRELATANPEALRGAGVYIVYAPKPEEDQDPKKKAAAQGVLDIANGIDSPAASLERKSQQEAENALSTMMSAGNQEDLQRAMSPQERMSYDQQRIGQLRHEISTQRKSVERARALIAKKARTKGQ